MILGQRLASCDSSMETGSPWGHLSERGSVPGPGLQNRRSHRPRFLPWHCRTLKKGSFDHTGLSSVFLDIQVTANNQMKLPFSVYYNHYSVNESSVSGCWVWMTWALRLRRAQCSPELLKKRSKRASLSLFFFSGVQGGDPLLHIRYLKWHVC